jgi:4-hydroxybenzoate polyprenyltransferase
VGCIYGATSYLDLLKPWFFLYFLYFLIIANIFLYGVNDYWDYDTDLVNPKKSAKEYRIKKNEREVIKKAIIIILGLSLILLILQNSIMERLIFGTFIFLSYFYSAKPLRFKDKPILDSASNFLYIIPSLFAFYLASGKIPDYRIILAGFLHTFAMHLFSAIPDIQFDKETEITTTAVLFGREVSLFICFIAWSGLSFITIKLSTSIFGFLTLVYPIIIIYLLYTNRKVIEVYWFYPYINIGLGGLMFTLKAVATPWEISSQIV